MDPIYSKDADGDLVQKVDLKPFLDEVENLKYQVKQDTAALGISQGALDAAYANLAKIQAVGIELPPEIVKELP